MWFFFSVIYFAKNEIKRWLKDLFHTCSLKVNILINLKFHGLFEKENPRDLHSLKVSNWMHSNCVKKHVYVLLRAWSRRAKHAFFWGTDLNCQSCLDRGSVGEAIGILMFGFSCSEPPASKMRTETFGSSESLFASTHPAEPAPTVITPQNHWYIQHINHIKWRWHLMHRRIKMNTSVFYLHMI